jgi:hypothetical protein
MQNIRKGPPDLLKVLQDHADLTNMPRVGTDDNVAHPSFQVNAASAKEADASGTASSIDGMGRFGDSHSDTGESKGCDTSLTTLSKPYAGVYDDIFFLHDLGVAWVQEPLSTISFSGLHLHSGTQPTYRPDRTDPGHIHYRLTLVGYSPECILDGSDALAFAALPKGTLLPSGYEMRFPLM